MSELNTLIERTLSEDTKEQIGKVQPDHINQLFEDIQSINRMTEVIMYVLHHYPHVFELAYKEALKNDNR